ncbi:MAG TPA: hypothetical protein VLN73_04270, partial [Alphaproteobacteria bacterium]|nr:hypothetical protein [Alphaproteobacteria bacterium]
MAGGPARAEVEAAKGRYGVMASKLEDQSFLFGANAGFIEKVYGRYLKDPDSVDPEWAEFFSGLQDNVTEALKEIKGASWAPRTDRRLPATEGAAPAAPEGESAISEETVRLATLDSIRALMMIRAYRVRGHLEADLDPLELAEVTAHPELDPATYGFTEDDY